MDFMIEQLKSRNSTEKFWNCVLPICRSLHGTEQECEHRCLNVCLKTGLLRNKNTALKITRKSEKKKKRIVWFQSE